MTEQVNMTEQVKSVSMARKVFAAILDFVTIFFGAGYAIGYATGGLSADGLSHGFSLEGVPVLIFSAVVVLYFVLGDRFGGTLWQRILRAR
jgi:hypothetical protein